MSHILVTGAGGYVGARLARRLLEQGDATLLLWVHAADEGELQRKRARLLEQLGGPQPRVRVLGGDLCSPQPFADLAREPITHVIHSAAVTRFNVERELAQAVNIEGTRALLDFARSRRELEGLDFLSTVYSSGLRPGRIPEEPLDDQHGFANHYEWSKWEAERLVRERCPVPWRILRVCTVIADDAGGAVSQQNAFHNTLKLLFYGLLSLVPGQPGTPLYFVTADYLEAALAELLERAPDGRVYHVSPDRAGALPLGELLELAFASFAQAEDFRRRRILPPLFVDREAFELLVAGVGSGVGSSVVGEAVASVAPFARQLFVDKHIVNERLLGATGSPPPASRPLIQAVCDHLVGTRWGRNPAPVHG